MRGVITRNDCHIIILLVHSIEYAKLQFSCTQCGHAWNPREKIFAAITRTPVIICKCCEKRNPPTLAHVFTRRVAGWAIIRTASMYTCTYLWGKLNCLTWRFFSLLYTYSTLVYAQVLIAIEFSHACSDCGAARREFQICYHRRHRSWKSCSWASLSSNSSSSTAG